MLVMYIMAAQDTYKTYNSISILIDNGKNVSLLKRIIEN